MLDKNFKDIISNIKEEIINTQIKTMQEVNSNLIMLYFKLGKIVSENKQYGNNFTKQVSTELKLTFPNMKGFSERNIRSMRLFYEEYAFDEKWQQLVAKLPWGHNLLLIEKIKDKDIRQIYAENTIKNGWSRNVLAIQIETEFHKRVGNSNNNFNVMLPPKDSDLVNNTIKDPYIFDFITLKEEYKEKELEEALIIKIRNVLLELGKGFSFVGNQYKISVDNQDYYIDLVFYNYILKCFVLIDLKTERITHQDVGQMDMYIRMYDELKKAPDDNPTLGIVLCSETDEDIARYSILHGNEQLFASKYKLYLPTEEELREEIETQKAIFYLQQKDAEEEAGGEPNA